MGKCTPSLFGNGNFETNLQMLLAQKGFRPKDPGPYMTHEKMLSHDTCVCFKLSTWTKYRNKPKFRESINKHHKKIVMVSVDTSRCTGILNKRSRANAFTYFL